MGISFWVLFWGLGQTFASSLSLEFQGVSESFSFTTLYFHHFQSCEKRRRHCTCSRQEGVEYLVPTSANPFLSTILVQPTPKKPSLPSPSLLFPTPTYTQYPFLTQIIVTTYSLRRWLLPGPTPSSWYPDPLGQRNQPW